MEYSVRRWGRSRRRGLHRGGLTTDVLRFPRADFESSCPRRKLKLHREELRVKIICLTFCVKSWSGQPKPCSRCLPLSIRASTCLLDSIISYRRLIHSFSNSGFCLTYFLAKNCRPFFWLVRDYNIRQKNPPVFFISQNVVSTKLLREVWDDDSLDRAQLPSRPVPPKYSQITSALLISTRYFLTLGM